VTLARPCRCPALAEVLDFGGYLVPLVGKLLGHTQAVTTQRYAHLRDDPLRAAAERIGGEIGAALSGGMR
jgi:integrase